MKKAYFHPQPVVTYDEAPRPEEAMCSAQPLRRVCAPHPVEAISPTRYPYQMPEKQRYLPFT